MCAVICRTTTIVPFLKPILAGASQFAPLTRRKKMSAETRKQRKQNRAKKDRRSLRDRRAYKRWVEATAWKIANQPFTPIPHANEFCFCPQCLMSFCVCFDGYSLFCHECPWVKHNPDACLKRQEKPLTLKCDHCGRRQI